MRTEMEQVIACKKNLLDQLCQTDYLDMVQQAAQVMTQCLRAGNKILLAGNGGSAADAQHFAGEIVGRFCMERRALPAISLCVDPSVMTCIGNDYGYDMVFERQLSGLGNAGDVFCADFHKRKFNQPGSYRKNSQEDGNLDNRTFGQNGRKAEGTVRLCAGCAIGGNAAYPGNPYIFRPYVMRIY